ncbi:hypothetical protein BJ912DRAFT_956443, partial [Pholiota molesta]
LFLAFLAICIQRLGLWISVNCAFMGCRYPTGGMYAAQDQDDRLDVGLALVGLQHGVYGKDGSRSTHLKRWAEVHPSYFVSNYYCTASAAPRTALSRVREEMEFRG